MPSIYRSTMVHRRSTKGMYLSICFLPGPVVHISYIIDLFSPSDKPLFHPSDNVIHCVVSHKKKLQLREISSVD